VTGRKLTLEEERQAAAPLEGAQLDNLSDWALPPAGDTVPVRVFDTAEAALAFLAATVPLDDTPAPAGKRLRRRLVLAAVR
jgi:hypothetical protein